MSSKLNKSILAIVLILFLYSIFLVSTDAASDKIQIDVKSRMLEGESVPVLIVLKDQPSLKALSKDNAVTSMKSLASSSQKSIASLLMEEKNKGKADKIKQFWIVNAIAVEASPALIERLAKRNDVVLIELDAELRIMNDLSARFHRGRLIMLHQK